MVTPSLSLLGSREQGHHVLLSISFYAVAVVLFLLVVILWLFDNIGRLLFVGGHATGIAVLGPSGT